MFTDRFGIKRYKICLHAHTTLSDGSLSPEAAAKVYKDAGYDAIAFTDHWYLGAENEIGGLKILPGCEYHFGTFDTIEGVIHIVALGMKTKPDLSRETTSWQHAIDAINNAGGIAILAHPAWSLNSPETIYSMHGFSAIEIFNTVSGDYSSDRAYAGSFIDLLANKGTTLPLIAADDTHFYTTDKTTGYVLVECENLTTDCVIDAIKNGKFYSTTGPELNVIYTGKKFIVDCSECVKIAYHSNLPATCVERGWSITHHEYTPNPAVKWLRVEATDKDGKIAWSNIFNI